MFNLQSFVRPSRMSGLFVVLAFLLHCAVTYPAFGATQGDSTTASLPVKAGWNLLSLPVEVTGGTKGTVFPTAISNAFVFDSAYRVVDTLENGRAFWIKFASAETISIHGIANYTDTVDLRAGWNMIGILSTPVEVRAIRTTPPGIVTSDYFGFFPPPLGYQKTDTLQPGTGYWVKVNQAGMMVMVAMDVPCSGIPAVDYEGKTYHTIQIGDQCWLDENLDAGTMIPGGTGQTNNAILEKYCYDDNPSNCALYGGLYLWDEAMQYATTAGTRGICPPGWHIPTTAEFGTLSTTVGGDGNAVKAEGQGSGAGAGTNTSGFSALLAGYRGGTGDFGSVGVNAIFWSSMVYGATEAFSVYLYDFDANIALNNANIRAAGFSVRCLED